MFIQKGHKLFFISFRIFGEGAGMHRIFDGEGVFVCRIGVKENVHHRTRNEIIEVSVHKQARDFCEEVPQAPQYGHCARA